MRLSPGFLSIATAVFSRKKMADVDGAQAVEAAPRPLLSLQELRTALTLTAASKSGDVDGQLAALMQMDLKDARGKRCNLNFEATPALVYSLLALLEEATSAMTTAEADE
jgi:hypothetical protein